MKSKKNAFLITAVVIIVLAAAWFLGGGAPGDLASAASKTPETSPAASIIVSSSDNNGIISTISPAPSKETAESGTPAPAASAAVTEAPASSPAATAGSPAKTAVPSTVKEPTPAVSSEPALPSNPEATAEVGTFICTLSVSCATILGHTDSFNPDKQGLLPADGVLFPAAEAVFYEGESVFNVLQREMKKAGIQMEFTNTPLYNSAYIEGIGNIYERDCGELSGWMYRVNGVFPGHGCSRCSLQDGDVVEFVYTCDLGRDVGGDFYANTDTEGGAA